MIKRTGERVLAWIGVGIQLLGVLIWGGLLLFMGSSGFKEELRADNPTLSPSQASESANVFFIIMGVGLAIGLIVLIGTIIGAIKIGKSNKLAGILLLVFGIISLIFNWISAILWIIAGIMLLVRKPAPNLSSDISRAEHTANNHNDIPTENNDSEHQSMKSLDEVERRKSDDPYKY
ncbi:DUF4064 domain-containing protein [Staphylococcus arlettae]|uniref:DUF4064 domain-containing protein n=1 Tax=Staphylococcus arlettae TaxID=29378 RepID=UPI000D1AEB4B|nr:DUF4064 domain-containing protein [Staphylococcus arlettae]MCD8833807.1 DUF4064 domain-containing protein [Staphylococcus arlettae]MCD9054033.1 DUF4064 domain-containing protein [Staphylococcus arlettae]PTH24341.1 hypothetical protein BU605_10910 [Staphylococcus arlettae]PTH24403.1 hypothetical protein BU602_00195 [Staphylococcus arlettae]PTH34356.1 hypothetical protein BU592_04555 [Staphylococcus arlettae]